MKQYPIDSPPTCPGIYLISNSADGRVYVGKATNLRRRYVEWKAAITTRIGVTSPAFLAAIEESSPANWTFSVVQELPGISEKDLADMEARTITHVANKRPGQILNQVVPKKTAARNPDKAPKSTIVDEGGAPVSYADAAAIIGTPTATLIKRLQKYRRRGVFDHNLSELKAKTERYKEALIDVTLA